MPERHQDWLRQARLDLDHARLAARERHLEWAVFAAQQAAEKALCEHFRTPQFGHNLNLLVQAVETHTSVAESMRMVCARLNRYDIPTRYPDAFDRGAPAEQFFEADAAQAVADAEEVLRFATDIIGSP